MSITSNTMFTVKSKQLIQYLIYLKFAYSFKFLFQVKVIGFNPITLSCSFATWMLIIQSLNAPLLGVWIGSTL